MVNIYVIYWTLQDGIAQFTMLFHALFIALYTIGYLPCKDTIITYRRQMPVLLQPLFNIYVGSFSRHIH